MAPVHASCVALGGRGVLLRGAPGAGKSDLALRLIDAGATLVSDDQVALDDGGAALLASPPARLAGLLEVRGLGIVAMAYTARCPLHLAVDLVASAAVERMPEADSVMLRGHRLARLALAPFEASTPAKVGLALRRAAAAPCRAERRAG